MSIDRDKLASDEAEDRIALHVSRIVARVIRSIGDKHRVERGIALARQLIDLLEGAIATPDAVRGEHPLDEVLRAIVGKRLDGSPDVIRPPATPLLDTTLLTNAHGEPRVGVQVVSEFESADRIDALMAFIRRSGIRTMRDAVRRHCDAGRQFRVLTTTYTGSTQVEALEELSELGAAVKVSYDTTSSRLHAKSWLFHRDSGFSTAYVGSSNLTYSAQTPGLEWNLRISAARNPDVVDKIATMFASYWAQGDFEDFDRDTFVDRTKDRGTSRTLALPSIELRLESFQERLLEQLELSRIQGHHRNLLVAATGTGKTVMSAVDYHRQRKRHPAAANLLFVAHRKEILEQSLDTFRWALRDRDFGELWVGGQRPHDFHHVFASIQSLNAEAVDRLPPGHFDIVIVDEFHHAAAGSYRRLLDKLEPRELLGLTATPERADGLDVVSIFGGRIAAELRLWDAINQQRLVPFAYYGIHDDVDLRDVPWKRGRGYDEQVLTSVLTADQVHAVRVLDELQRHVDDIEAVRGLGFCVSVAHAEFMAAVFEREGFPARALSGSSSEGERAEALGDLRAGRIRMLFSVDLFNEGLDIPSINTLLLLRPTESATLFVQQLGRGLRREDGKSACLVLDFVGLHRAEFRFDRRFLGLFGGTRSQLKTQVESGFPYLPAGCHMQLDAKSREVVLESLRSAIPFRRHEMIDILERMHAAGAPTTLRAFLDESGLELEDVYAPQRCFRDLLEEASITERIRGPFERELRSAIGRLLHVDDLARLDGYATCLRRGDASSTQPTATARLTQMLVGSMLSRTPKLDKSTLLAAGLDILRAHEAVCDELGQLFELLRERITHVHEPLGSHPDCPLQIHARYTRVEILAAFGERSGFTKIPAWQTGVRWLSKAKADLLAFTIDKSTGGFSPTTRYRDYAISPELIHWESQSVVREASETGQRYQAHAARGSHVMLFARESTATKHYWFLGPARYVSHSGECPMGITWRLEHPLPGDVFAALSAVA
ncbi:MAG: DUF3427 domain-containing protein [Planctomycetes bacterium]|nr:DUF3427 domain-containing protein [Planctomycetota bacterium]